MKLEQRSKEMVITKTYYFQTLLHFTPLASNAPLFFCQNLNKMWCGTCHLEPRTLLRKLKDIVFDIFLSLFLFNYTQTSFDSWKYQKRYKFMFEIAYQIQIM